MRIEKTQSPPEEHNDNDAANLAEVGFIYEHNSPEESVAPLDGTQQCQVFQAARRKIEKSTGFSVRQASDGNPDPLAVDADYVVKETEPVEADDSCGFEWSTNKHSFGGNETPDSSQSLEAAMAKAPRQKLSAKSKQTYESPENNEDSDEDQRVIQM